MLSVSITGYAPPCSNNSGGISRAWVFDPADMDFTQATETDPYTAVALVAGATVVGGSGFKPIKFDYLEAEHKAVQSLKGSSNKWAHTLALQVPQHGQKLSEFLLKQSIASSCGSLGFVIEQNNGKVIVIGESVVNASTIPVFRIVMDGTEDGSGKAFDDVNGAKLMYKGDYSRPAWEYTGGIDAIIALQGV